MPREYFVIDGNGYTSSSNHKGEPEPEAFVSFRDAERRAQQLLKYFPLHTVVITQAIAYVTREVLQPKTEMKTRKLRKPNDRRASPARTPAAGAAKTEQGAK